MDHPRDSTPQGNLTGVKADHALLTTLMDNMGAGVIIVDVLTRVIERVNPTTADLFGTPAEAIEGKVCHKFLCPAEENACPITDLHQEVDKSDRILLRKDGAKVPIIKTVKRISIDGSDKLVETFIDITERKKAEESLKESEEKFRSITEQSADGIVVTDENGCIVEWNNAQAVFTGFKREDVLNKPLWEVQGSFASDSGEKRDILNKLRNETLAFLRGERDWSKEKRERTIVLPNGSKKTIAESAFLVRQNRHNMGVFVVNNVTEKKEAEVSKAQYEAYMQQAQRLESLGILAAGIAHDFNNILMGVFGYTELAKSQIEDPVATEYLAQAMESMERARGLTQQLLTFSKGGAPIKRITDISSLIKETCEFALHGSCVTCDMGIASDLRHSDADKNQIGQVIQNLMLNAIQAMPMGGSIKVRAHNITFQEREHPTLGEGDYIRIEVEDHGTGIPKEMLPRIFDPFFTTKTKGHGLGLAISHSIMARHNGAINVTSVMGEGTTFSLYLPASGERLIEDTTPLSDEHQGTGTVLVMDDEYSVRSLISTMLRSVGYEVVVTKNGVETLEVFKNALIQNKRFSALILDLTIPGGIGGKEVAAEIRKADQRTPLFVASGYAEDPILANPIQFGFTASVPKPFRKTDLLHLLSTYANVETK